MFPVCSSLSVFPFLTRLSVSAHQLFLGFINSLSDFQEGLSCDRFKHVFEGWRCASLVSLQLPLGGSPQVGYITLPKATDPKRSPCPLPPPATSFSFLPSLRLPIDMALHCCCHQRTTVSSSFSYALLTLL